MHKSYCRARNRELVLAAGRMRTGAPPYGKVEAYIAQALSSCAIKVNGLPLSMYKPEPVRQDVADAVLEQQPRVRAKKESRDRSNMCYHRIDRKWNGRVVTSWKHNRKLKWRKINVI